MALTLPSGESGLPALPWALLDEFASKYPLLAEWLTASSFSDGSAKKPGRVSIGIHLGQVTAQLQLPGTGLMLRTSVPDPLLAFEALEMLLGRDPVPFERDPWTRVEEPQKGPSRKRGPGS